MQEVKITKNEQGHIVLLIDNKPIGPIAEVTFKVKPGGITDAIVTFPNVIIDINRKKK